MGLRAQESSKQYEEDEIESEKQCEEDEIEDRDMVTASIAATTCARESRVVLESAHPRPRDLENDLRFSTANELPGEPN